LAWAAREERILLSFNKDFDVQAAGRSGGSRSAIMAPSSTSAFFFSSSGVRNIFRETQALFGDLNPTPYRRLDD
jgi:hypothetical protein